MKILFAYEHQYPKYWKDGLWAALNLLEKDGFKIYRWNLLDEEIPNVAGFDFILGWGAFNSPVHHMMISDIPKYKKPEAKMGLCIGGIAAEPNAMYSYDVLFYETEWYLPKIMNHRRPVHAFGINTDIYQKIDDAFIIWDWLTVGAFSTWKRQEKLLKKGGYKLAIGEVQKGNMGESGKIINDLLKGGVMVSDMVEPERLVFIYNAAERVYIPADINGGGERSVLEARACGRPVEVEFDNPKLYELTKSPIWDQFYYFDALKRGINSCF